MIYELGPRALHVWRTLRDRMRAGEFAAGDRLPGHRALAELFGVAPLTIRHVLSRLEDEGLVIREPGRGTFVRRRTAPSVLIVDDDPEVRITLREYVRRAGCRALESADPASALGVLAAETDVVLVLADVRMPAAADGIAFIRRVRQRWPQLTLAAVTGYPDDLAALQNTPDCPALVISKALHPRQIEEVLRLALGTMAGATAGNTG